MVNVVHIVLFTFLAVIALAIIRLKDLFAAVMLMGIFSLLSASLFTVMDAVDVAFTEASVGAGVSTLLMLAALSLTEREEHPDHNRPKLAELLPRGVPGPVQHSRLLSLVEHQHMVLDEQGLTSDAFRTMCHKCGACDIDPGRMV